MPDKTPGQICYEAWHAIVIPALVPGYGEDWNQVSALEQRAWEAAAQAVLDAWQTQVDLVVQAQEAPPRRWTLQPLTLDLDPDVPRKETP